MLNKSHSGQVAQLHISGIAAGFISSLGIDFVTALYEAIAKSKYSFGFIAMEDDTVLGFVAFSTDINSLYKSVICQKGLQFGFLLIRKIFSRGTIKRILETLFYPSRIKKTDLPSAELLSVVVDESARGKGIAEQLIKEGLNECGKRGIEDVRVLVAANNDAANKLYQKCGFRLFTQIYNHGILSNLLLAKIRG